MRHFSWLKASMLLLAMLLGRQFQSSAAELPRTLELTIGQGRILDFSNEVIRVYTSNPEVADVAVIDSKEIVVNAKGAGKATLAVWLQSGGNESIPVTVELDLSPIQKLLDQAFRDDKLTVSGTKETLVLLGQARKAVTVERALAMLKPFAQGVVSSVEVIPLGEERQIALHVIFAELDRTASESFGINLISTGAGNTPGQTSTGQFSPATPSQLAAGTGTTFALGNALNIFAFRPDLNLAATIQALQSKGVPRACAAKRGSRRRHHGAISRIRHTAEFHANHDSDWHHQAPCSAGSVYHRYGQWNCSFRIQHSRFVDAQSRN